MCEQIFSYSYKYGKNTTPFSFTHSQRARVSDGVRALEKRKKHLCDKERLYFVIFLSACQRVWERESTGDQEWAVNCNVTCPCKCPTCLPPPNSVKFHEFMNAHFQVLHYFLCVRMVWASCWGWHDVDRGNPGINYHPRRMNAQLIITSSRNLGQELKVRSGTLTDWDVGPFEAILLVSQGPGRPQVKAGLQEFSKALQR